VEPRDAAFDLCGVAGKFLAKGQWCRVLGMGEADLADVLERCLLPAQRGIKSVECREEVARDALGGGDVHHRRE
jgi:hypothetical protein